MDTVDGVPTFSSRWCRQKFVCQADLGTADYLGYVERLLGRGVGVLVASHDGTIALLRQHRARLEQRVRLALASEAAMTIAVNKERTLAVARRLGIAVPRSVPVGTSSEVSEALREIGLPAVVKPTESWLWGGRHGARVAPRLVTTPDEARTVVGELTDLGGTTLMQQLLSGRREAVSFVYAKGEMYAQFAQWEKRTNPPLGGEGVLRQSIAVPADIGAQADRLVREIGLEGYSQVEFRRDTGGVPYLMEINPRLSASVELAVRCGVDFPYLHYQWASGEAIDRVEGYSVGRWLRYLAGDLESTMDVVHQRGRAGVPPASRALLSFGLAFLRRTGYDGIDWSDPVPTVRSAAHDARYFIGRIVRKAASVCRRKIS